MHGYVRTSILLLVFNQIVGFSGKSLHIKNLLFCVVNAYSKLSATTMTTKMRKILVKAEKAIGLTNKTKTVKMQHTFWQISLLSLHN